MCFKVSPVTNDGRSVGENAFVRTGLLGFLGPVCFARVTLIKLCTLLVCFTCILHIYTNTNLHKTFALNDM